MQKSEKEQVVAELTERLGAAQALIVADYRGLANSELEALRDELTKHGARFAVVKNTLTRRAAEAAGADAVLALLEGPTAIAFIETDGDPVAVAKALGETARDTRVLTVRGGVLEGRGITADDIENLAKLPPADVLRGQVVGALTAPLYAIVGLFTAPLQNLHGLIEARIEQLEQQGDTSASEASAGAVETDAAPEATVEPADGGNATEADPTGETLDAADADEAAAGPQDATATEADATAAPTEEDTETPAADAAEATEAEAENAGAGDDQ